jgi:cytochrome b561
MIGCHFTALVLAFQFTQHALFWGIIQSRFLPLDTMSAPHPTTGSPTVPRYTTSTVLLHWLLAAALIAQLALGWWMLDLPKSPPGLRAGWFNVHKSVGLTIAFVVLVRVVWRAGHPPAADELLPRWQRVAARTAHALLYGCMLVIPLSGFLGSNFTRYPVLYFGHALPAWNHDWPAAKEAMSAVHLGAVGLLVALIAVHVAAALWHWLQRDGVTARMGIPSLSGH